jgi:hypothetical protein
MHNQEHLTCALPSIIRMIKLNSVHMSKECSTKVGEEECIYGTGRRTRRKEITRKDKM